ncbi:MAG TPA: hypothetical protein PLD20_32575 [Blastocatellia bacterium]|nr:hypothetical protein [Blastocatellia bacterium]HMY73084.1 hypothetical protein [Blastocatellia bacterium]HMZ22709.1 hypothetical protein [Blastocatellia bacterium]HNG34657.1 hypothetical protein [Blastocatellia bacterium]
MANGLAVRALEVGRDLSAVAEPSNERRAAKPAHGYCTNKALAASKPSKSREMAMNRGRPDFVMVFVVMEESENRR